MTEYGIVTASRPRPTKQSRVGIASDFVLAMTIITMPREYWVYILTNQHDTVLYTGVTSNLEARIQTHRDKQNPKAFTARYNVEKLVWCESTDDVGAAIEREKQIKAGSRAKKIALIKDMNPEWEDLLPRT